MTVEQLEDLVFDAIAKQCDEIDLVLDEPAMFDQTAGPGITVRHAQIGRGEYVRHLEAPDLGVVVRFTVEALIEALEQLVVTEQLRGIEPPRV